MAVRSIPYIHPTYSLPASVAQRQTRVGAPLGEETNQISVWPYPKGTSVPLSIDSIVSLVTLDWGFPRCYPELYEDHHGITEQTHSDPIAFQP
jgi:hypothetical protein